MEALQQEHERLLRDVRKKKDALSSLEALANELEAEFLGRFAPLHAELERLARQVGRFFDTLLGSGSRLNRKDKAKVRSIYLDVLSSLPPELRYAIEKDAAGEVSSDRSSDEFAFDDFDFDFDDDPASAGRDPRASGGARWSDAGAGGHWQADAGYSAAKPNDAQSGTLRALFRRLATLLHPDKVQDEEEKAERTSVMKDVTRAYESGDLARLVELERLHVGMLPVVEDPEAFARHITQLTAANRELRRQLRDLTEGRKAVRDSLPFALDLRAKSRLRERGMEQLERLVDGVRQEIDEFRIVHDFVERFAAGKMGVREFLAGPALPLGAEEAAVLDELSELDELLGEVFEALRDFQPKSRPRRRSTSRARR